MACFVSAVSRCPVHRLLKLHFLRTFQFLPVSIPSVFPSILSQPCRILKICCFTVEFPRLLHLYLVLLSLIIRVIDKHDCHFHDHKLKRHGKKQHWCIRIVNDFKNEVYTIDAKTQSE